VGSTDNLQTIKIKKGDNYPLWELQHYFQVVLFKWDWEAPITAKPTNLFPSCVSRIMKENNDDIFHLGTSSSSCHYGLVINMK
jgi:hypothetical protein